MMLPFISTDSQVPLVKEDTASDQVLPFFPLVRSITRKFARGEAYMVPYDELYSEAMFGLVYAQQHFKPYLNVPFEKYTMMVICHRLRNLVGYWLKHCREVPMPRSKFNRDIEWQPCADIDDDRDDTGRDAANQKFWQHIEHHLTEREYSIVQMHFQQQLSPRQIATRLKISKQRVCQLIVRAKRKLRATWEHNPPAI